MGSHKEWRKIAKRERRRRIRTKLAKSKDPMPSPDSEDYKQWLHEQECLEKFELEQIELRNEEENEKWLNAEKLSIVKYKKLAEEQERERQKQIELQIKLQQEWELEKQRKEKEEERLRLMEEELKIKQEKFMLNLEQYLSGDSTEPPQELLIYHETRPNAQLCPFFIKTACCRFGDQCSRNHQYPGISKILLATNFYVHFGLENANYTEYDTDVMLEYEENDTYRHYKEFFEDVLPEFQKYGNVLQFKVCNNYEKHLRGNTYIEYADLRSAVRAYRALHARWYGGKQVSLQFCQIASWKNAICGLQSRKLCPKGRACNFLHVFTNPRRLNNQREESRIERKRVSSSHSWRWSESPERIKSPDRQIKRKRSRSRERRSSSNADRKRHSSSKKSASEKC